MSENNGTLQSARDRLREVRVQSRIRKTEAEIKLLENAMLYFGYSSNQFNSFVDPADSAREPGLSLGVGGFFAGTAMAGNCQYGADPFVPNEVAYGLQRGLARELVRYNRTARGIVRRLTNFTIRTGYRYEVKCAEKEYDQKLKNLVACVQSIIDEFCDRTDWSFREQSLFRRSIRDGEVFIRYFNCDGKLKTRIVEPEQIRQPLGSPKEWSFGILTEEGDIESVLGYAVFNDTSDNWEEVPASEIAHLKLNVDESVKRGLSDFFNTEDALNSVHKLLKNMVVGGSLQAAIAWVEQYEGASAAAISSTVSDRIDQWQPPGTRPITGKPYNFAKFEAGTIPKVPKGKQYIPSPSAGNAASYTTITQAMLRSIGAIWDMPEYMISGDVGNSNYASTLVAGGPFTIAIETAQDVYRLFFLRTLWTSVRLACETGRVVVDGVQYSFVDLKRLLTIHATSPQVSTTNKSEEASIDRADIAAGVLSIQTRREKLGLDNEKEQQNIKLEPPKPEGGQQKPQEQQQLNPLAAITQPPKGLSEAEEKQVRSILESHNTARAVKILRRTVELLEKKDDDGNEHAADGKFTSGSGGERKAEEKKEKHKPGDETHDKYDELASGSTKRANERHEKEKADYENYFKNANSKEEMRAGQKAHGELKAKHSAERKADADKERQFYDNLGSDEIGGDSETGYFSGFKQVADGVFLAKPKEDSDLIPLRKLSTEDVRGHVHGPIPGVDDENEVINDKFSAQKSEVRNKVAELPSDPKEALTSIKSWAVDSTFADPDSSGSSQKLEAVFHLHDKQAEPLYGSGTKSDGIEPEMVHVKPLNGDLGIAYSDGAYKLVSVSQAKAKSAKALAKYEKALKSRKRDEESEE